MGVQVQDSAQMRGWLPKSRLVRDLPGRQFGSCDRQARQGQFALGAGSTLTVLAPRRVPTDVGDGAKAQGQTTGQQVESLQAAVTLLVFLHEAIPGVIEREARAIIQDKIRVE